MFSSTCLPAPCASAFPVCLDCDGRAFSRSTAAVTLSGRCRARAR